MMLGGLGHGWASAFAVSCGAVVASPLSVVAWHLRRRPTGRRLAWVLLAAAVVANIALVVATRHEGFGYFQKAWSSLPLAVLAWAVLWSAWQVLVLLALFRRA